MRWPGALRGAPKTWELGALLNLAAFAADPKQVAERRAETGAHHITRDAAAYRAMLRAAIGGGTVIAGTTFVKFMVLALRLSAFWGGLWAGLNQAASFVIVQLLHWTVATKQPAMTAPAMADKLTDMSGRLPGFGSGPRHPTPGSLQATTRWKTSSTRWPT